MNLKKLMVRTSSADITPEIGMRIILDWAFSLSNKYATIRNVSDGSISVEFDLPINGHSCGGFCKYGHGFYISKTRWDDGQIKIYP